MERYAVIDMGTNSARLMLAEAEGKSILRTSKRLITCRTGEGVAAEGAIAPAAFLRTADALNEFKADAGDARLMAFATSAIREAQNREEFVAYIKEKCGIDIDVISGQEEARCGFAGALGGKAGGIIDIGGGSTEIMAGDGRAIDYVHSFYMGAVRSLSDYPDDYSGLYAWARATVEGENPPRGVEYTAIGGTATALTALFLEMEAYDPARVNGYVIERQALAALANRLRAATIEERRAIKGMEERRADVIGYGATILESVMDALGLTRVTASERDSLEGYLQSKL